MGKRDSEDAQSGRRSKQKPSRRGNKAKRIRALSKQVQEQNEVIRDEVLASEDTERGQETEVSQVEESDCVDIEGGDDDMDASSVSIISNPNPSTPKSAAPKKSECKKLNTKAVMSALQSSAVAKPHAAVIASTSTPPNAKKKRRRDSGTSSEEERWLTAIESGKLEDVDDELKKIKDPKLMTARQRAMYVRNMDQEGPPPVELLMSLPTGYREKEKPQTAEELQKAALKSQKRKQMADEKREKDKKKTMERLLKKQDNKQRSAGRKQSAKVTQPMISYRNTPDGAFMHLPAETELPIPAQGPRQPPKVQLCGIAGCGNPKIYNCSKTNLPLCSFSCYRKNVQAVRQIMC